ncbi:MAG: hypothetical protein U0354_03990 [Candidatus Sericytochromatia bacterium]
MKNSKILTGSLLATIILVTSCDKYNGLSQTKSPSSNTAPQSSPSVSSSSANNIPSFITPSGSGLGIISTPKPVSNLEEKSPTEPEPYKTAAPFIIGKPGVSFNSTINTDDAGPIVTSKISGKVYGYETNTKTYKTLSNAQVSINGAVVNTDSSGNYSSSDTFDSAVDLSASASGYYKSTVSDIRPGENRNIHLQPIDSRPIYNSNTISFDILSLAAAEPTNTSPLTATTTAATTTAATTEVKLKEPTYTSLLTFADTNNSRFITKVVDNDKGRIRVEVNPIGTQSIAKGQLLVYDIERDASGRPTNPTQMKKFIHKKDIAFRVGDQYFPGTEPTTKDSTSTSSAKEETFDLIKNFANINVKFNDSFGFNNFVCNAYAIFSTGEKLLVSRYTGASATSLSFRVPKIVGSIVSYSIEAHAGNANFGSDVVVNDLHENDSVEAYLLQPPSDLSPNHDTLSTSLFPTFSWSANQEAKSFQVDVKDTNTTNESAWEGYSSKNTIKYPIGLGGLKLNAQYSFQVVAMDFNFGGLRVLSADTNKAEEMRLRAVRQKDNDLPFKVQLASHESKTLPKGYRVSYNTVLFRAK